MSHQKLDIKQKNLKIKNFNDIMIEFELESSNFKRLLQI